MRDPRGFGARGKLITIALLVPLLVILGFPTWQWVGYAFLYRFWR